jgi:hypothetical protein
MQSMYNSKTDDLSWFNLYSIKVRLGYPRTMKQISISETGRYELLEDTITHKRFIAPLEPISAGIQPGNSYIAYYKGAQETYKFIFK